MSIQPCNCYTSDPKPPYFKDDNYYCATCDKGMGNAYFAAASDRDRALADLAKERERLKVLEDDRRRALKRADELTLDTQTCEEAVTALVSMTRVARADAERLRAELETTKARLAEMEWERDEARDGYRRLDDNWATLHNVGMNALREALHMPDTTVPEMVERIAAISATGGKGTK